MNADGLKKFFHQDVDHLPTEENDTSQSLLPRKPEKTSLQEKPNRLGLSQDSLHHDGKRLRKASEGTPSASSLSAVAKRRQSLDAFFDQAGKQQSASNDMMSMFCLMEDAKKSAKTSAKNVRGNNTSSAKSENISNSCCAMSVKSAYGAMKTSTALAKNNYRWQSR
ncbi:hypothetical protein DYB37_010311 [Aphanomyces astaci]|uniref:Uncharacterized protein n=1 Tax=Aphanomyces astaci TaxID=112090 RepID=A0A397D4K4_APHAT|nr:hypothetical protein DYB36_013315 [Aphanomyces astaci]RHY23482.1 hypothetical protein DYB25_008898 [Aphanomyces astaci]RHY41707.1 hypothetical protein DYB30_004742 [Aphanomyces astaci]RHY55956.1 hypothetical protein DYB38_013125 [Aphanomyces astaci]RHY58072.1 hypothetical protein DYB34_006318 [Aphanomyces astaci]